MLKIIDIADSERHDRNVVRIKHPRLAGFGKPSPTHFGGASLKGNPRQARPISTKRCVHLVMRSSIAKGTRSFLHPERAQKIKRFVFGLGRVKGVRVYQFANSGNHLHLLILPSSRRAFQAYIRGISGVIARITMNVERGRPMRIKFWDARPFTHIVEWGRHFFAVERYIRRNILEAIGFIPYQPRTVAMAPP